METITASLHHLIEPPPSAPPAGKPPALILLHGYGSSERDLLGLTPHLDRRLLFISARAPSSLAAGSFYWYEFLQIGRPEPRTFQRGLDLLTRFVTEVVAGYPVDPERVYLLGFSQGAVMSVATLLALPARIAGIVALSGYVPPTAERAEQPDALRGRAVFIAHGTADSLIPIAAGHQARDFFARLPVELTYREYPMAHQIGAETLRDVAEWLRARLDG